METFRINRNSWHYKMNRRFSPHHNNPDYMKYNWEPRHSNFCAYWRATVAKLVWMGFMAFGIAGLFYGIATAIYVHPVVALKVTGSIIGVIAVIIALLFLFSGISKMNEKVTKSNSLLLQKYRAQKSKICPTVEFE